MRLSFKKLIVPNFQKNVSMDELAMSKATIWVTEEEARAVVQDLGNLIFYFGYVLCLISIFCLDKFKQSQPASESKGAEESELNTVIAAEVDDGNKPSSMDMVSGIIALMGVSVSAQMQLPLLTALLTYMDGDGYAPLSANFVETVLIPALFAAMETIRSDQQFMSNSEITELADKIVDILYLSVRSSRNKGL